MNGFKIRKASLSRVLIIEIYNSRYEAVKGRNLSTWFRSIILASSLVCLVYMKLGWWGVTLPSQQSVSHLRSNGWTPLRQMTRVLSFSLTFFPSHMCAILSLVFTFLFFSFHSLMHHYIYIPQKDSHNCKTSSFFFFFLEFYILSKNIIIFNYLIILLHLIDFIFNVFLYDYLLSFQLSLER